MIAIAALLQKPLIMMDEPTSALDADSTDKVVAFLNQQTAKGCAILAVSHDKRFAMKCHHLIQL